MAPARASIISRDCPACSRATVHSLRFKKNGSDILQCTACGLGRAETSNFDPTTYYTADYFSGGHADGYSDYRGAEAVLRREFAGPSTSSAAFARAVNSWNWGAPIEFLLQEASHHFEVAGIELSHEAAAYCHGQGLRVLQGIADEAHLEQIGRVDVVVLLDVIEHLPQPRKTLGLCSGPQSGRSTLSSAPAISHRWLPGSAAPNGG